MIGNRRGAHLRRSGGLNPVVTLGLGSLTLLGLATASMLGLRAGHSQTDQPVIRVYCAAGVAVPVEQALTDFNSRGVGQAEMTRIGGSGRLLGQIAMERALDMRGGADLYVSADASLIRRGQQQQIMARGVPLARQHPVIAVRSAARFPAPTTISEMIATRRFGVANENAAIGELTRTLAEEEGQLAALEASAALDAENVMHLAQALATGALDAAIIWNTTVAQINQQSETPRLQVAALLEPPKGSEAGVISLAVVRGTGVPEAAERLARFIADREGGLGHLDAQGFQVIGETP